MKLYINTKKNYEWVIKNLIVPSEYVILFSVDSIDKVISQYRKDTGEDISKPEYS